MHGVRVREAEVLPGDCLTLGRTEITFRYRRATPGPETAVAETAASETLSARQCPGPGRTATGYRRPRDGRPAVLV